GPLAEAERPALRSGSGQGAGEQVTGGDGVCAVPVAAGETEARGGALEGLGGRDRGARGARARVSARTLRGEAGQAGPQGARSRRGLVRSVSGAQSASNGRGGGSSDSAAFLRASSNLFSRLSSRWRASSLARDGFSFA